LRQEAHALHFMRSANFHRVDAVNDRLESLAAAA